MPYGRKLVDDPSPSGNTEPVVSAAVVTALVALLVNNVGIDSETAELLVIGVTGVISTIIARAKVRPLAKGA